MTAWEKRRIKYRPLPALLLAGLLALVLAGCGRQENLQEVPPEPETEDPAMPEEVSVADQVLEVGFLASSCSNPYVVVAYETLCDLAGKQETPFVVEIHDGRVSSNGQRDQLGQVMKKGADLLIVDIADPEQEAALAEALSETGLPVIYFHNRPSKETLERTDSCWIGLTEEEEKDLQYLLDKDIWQQETWWRERAQEAGEELIRLSGLQEEE